MLVPWGQHKEILSIIYLQDRADFNDIVRMLEGQATKGGSVEVAKQEAKTTELKVFSNHKTFTVSLHLHMYKKWST